MIAQVNEWGPLLRARTSRAGAFGVIVCCPGVSGATGLLELKPARTSYVICGPLCHVEMWASGSKVIQIFKMATAEPSREEPLELWGPLKLTAQASRPGSRP